MPDVEIYNIYWENMLLTKHLFVTQVAIAPTAEDVSISFLPLAHMFERIVQVRLR